MARGEGGYIGSTPTWPTDGEPLRRVPGIWRLDEAYARKKRDAWTTFFPPIGSEFEGGFFAGLISHTANSVPTHALIVAPRATGATGTGYTLTTNPEWKTSQTTTAGTTSDFDGAANTAAMVAAGIANHPAAEFCVNLTINGFSDWYLPARYELHIAYDNFKPTTQANNTSFGINPYSVPERTVNRTAGDPGQTSVVAFQSGGGEDFVAFNHWTSTEFDATRGWSPRFQDGLEEGTTKLSVSTRVRAFRRIAL